MNASDGLRRYCAGALLVIGMLAAVLATAEVGGPVRLLITLVFLLVGPGWAVAAYLPGASAALTWAAATAVSIALSIVVAQVMLMLGAWHPTRALVLLAAASAPLLVHHLVRTTRAAS
ncbi:hypothetical protein F0L68_15785 [Solihabitans fulvus]|uniref:Uncharacterized protein n=1 Tax=Solihabitans fulvus TaxID=1892852 RepID=A0A5B2XEN3_9PSEU|nr:hypothetical protein [Solihabitans fulvus]KAA2261706.1 hypothetical protein F0L68_15785 [Solihabitans fulvus]